MRWDILQDDPTNIPQQKVMLLPFLSSAFCLTQTWQFDSTWSFLPEKLNLSWQPLAELSGQWACHTQLWQSSALPLKTNNAVTLQKGRREVERNNYVCYLPDLHLPEWTRRRNENERSSSQCILAVMFDTGSLVEASSRMECYFPKTVMYLNLLQLTVAGFFPAIDMCWQRFD